MFLYGAISRPDGSPPPGVFCRPIYPADTTMTKVSSEADRAAEIEVTPRMTEAGLRVLWASGAVENPIQADRLLVSRIYREMVVAARQGLDDC